METTGPIRILVVEDHNVVREGLIAMINLLPNIFVVAAAANGEDSIELFREHLPDITLMDLRLPGMSGVETIVMLRKEHPGARIIVLTTYSGDASIYRALQAGAQAYLLKDMFREDLMEAINAVYNGHRYIPKEVGARLAEHAINPELSPRELEILEQIAKGRNNKEIANKLFITEGTVKGHVTNILTKLSVKDRSQAVAVAIERGIIYF